MYPLRRKPSKLCSKVVIVFIWIAGFAFALPMGLVHTFNYVDDFTGPAEQLVGDDGEIMTVYTTQKPFCYLDFGPNPANSTKRILFNYYR